MVFKKILTSFVLAAALSVTGCVFEPLPEEAATVPSRHDDVLVGIDVLTKAGAEMLAVNSVRLVAFDSRGLCVVNRKYTSDIEVKSTDTGFRIAIKDPVTLSGNGHSYAVYAVVNEDGFLSALSGTSTTLGEKLGTYLPNTYCYEDFLEIQSLRLGWNANSASVSNVEPAFVILAGNPSVQIPSGESTGPYTISITSDDNPADRPLSMIEITKITSEAADGSNYNELADAAKVFVMDVTLSNIPSSYTLLPEGSSISGGPMPAPPTVQYETLKLGSSDSSTGFYNRVWPGTISQQVKGRLKQKEHIINRYYRAIAGSQGDGCWAFIPFNQAVVYNTMDDTDRAKANNGNIRNFINESLIPLFQDPKNAIQDPIDASGLEPNPAIPSKTPWNITMGQSFYVPENLQTERSAATGIIVRLALSEPYLDFSNVPLTVWDGWATWDSPVFTSDGTPIAEHTNDSRDFLATFSHTCWADDPDKIDVVNPNGKYKYFCGNFAREKSGVIDKTLKTGDSNILTGWNPANQSTKYLDVFIPINDNQFDSDYSVRRNTKYSVTLRVNGSTYTKVKNNASAPSKGGCEMPLITAVVTAEPLIN